MLGGYMRLAAALVYAFLFATTALVGCGGDDSNYGTNLFDDPFSEKKSSSSTKYNFSSSSRNRSSSSVDNAYSSSSNYISNNEQLYSADTTVNTSTATNTTEPYFQFVYEQSAVRTI